MNLLLPTLFLAVSALCAWKAKAVGRALKRLDGGRLARDSHGWGGDARAYTFFVRSSSLMAVVFWLFAAIGQLIHR